MDQPSNNNSTSLRVLLMDSDRFLSYFVDTISDVGLGIGWAILIALIGLILIQIIIWILKKVLAHKKLDKTVVIFSISATNVILKLILVIICIDVIGIQAISMAAIVASIGIAIGLALSGLLQNFVAGTYLVIAKPISLNHYVSVDGNVEGTVLDIGVITTTILTTDRRQVIVPNSNLASHNIVNYDKEEIRRCDRTVRVAFNEDLSLIRQVVLNFARHEPKVLLEPRPQVRVLSLEEADSSLVLSVRVFVHKDDYWDIWLALPEKIKEEFARAQIPLQIPQKQIFLYSQNSERPMVDRQLKEDYQLELSQVDQHFQTQSTPNHQTEQSRQNYLSTLKKRLKDQDKRIFRSPKVNGPKREISEGTGKTNCPVEDRTRYCSLGSRGKIDFPPASDLQIVVVDSPDIVNSEGDEEEPTLDELPVELRQLCNVKSEADVKKQVG